MGKIMSAILIITAFIHSRAAQSQLCYPGSNSIASAFTLTIPAEFGSSSCRLFLNNSFGVPSESFNQLVRQVFCLRCVPQAVENQPLVKVAVIFDEIWI